MSFFPLSMSDLIQSEGSELFNHIIKIMNEHLSPGTHYFLCEELTKLKQSHVHGFVIFYNVMLHISICRRNLSKSL